MLDLTKRNIRHLRSSPTAINYFPVDAGSLASPPSVTTNEIEMNYYFTNIRFSLFLKGPPNGLPLQQQNMQTFMKKSLVKLYVYLVKWLMA